MAFAFGKMVQLKRSLEQNNAGLRTKLSLLIPIKTKKEAPCKNPRWVAICTLRALIMQFKTHSKIMQNRMCANMCACITTHLLSIETILFRLVLIDSIICQIPAICWWYQKTSLRLAVAHRKSFRIFILFLCTETKRWVLFS